MEHFTQDLHIVSVRWKGLSPRRPGEGQLAPLEHEVLGLSKVDNKRFRYVFKELRGASVTYLNSGVNTSSDMPAGIPKDRSAHENACASQHQACFSSDASPFKWHLRVCTIMAAVGFLPDAHKRARSRSEQNDGKDEAESGRPLAKPKELSLRTQTLFVCMAMPAHCVSVVSEGWAGQ